MEIKCRNVKWHPKINKISQAVQQGVEYAFLSQSYDQVHQLLWCKDFLQDVIHGYLHNRLTEIHDFVYDPVTSPQLCLTKTLLMVANWKDPEFGTKLINGVLPLLHEVEQKLGMSKTYIEKCSSPPPRYIKSGVWILNSSKRWSKSPPMISFFTLLIRIGLIRQPEDDLVNLINKIKNEMIDPQYLEDYKKDKYNVIQAEVGILKILKYGDRKLFYSKAKDNYPTITYDVYGTEQITKEERKSRVTIYTIHDDCGVVAFSGNYTKQFMPYWHRFDQQEGIKS